MIKSEDLVVSNHYSFQNILVDLAQEYLVYVVVLFAAIMWSPTLVTAGLIYFYALTRIQFMPDLDLRKVF